MAPHLRVSIEKGARWSNYVDDDVIIASVPTLGRKASGSCLGRLGRFDPRDFKAIIIDEAHHSVADTYKRIMAHFGLSTGSTEVDREHGSLVSGTDKDPEEGLGTKTEAEIPRECLQGKVENTHNSGLLLWGCSATFSRNDELALGDVFEKVVYHRDIRAMMDEGWLCTAQVYQVSTTVDLQSVRKVGGDWDQGALSLAINTPTRNSLVAATWLEVARRRHQRQATIVFALNVEHAQNLLNAFVEVCGITPALVTSATDTRERESILQRFSEGTLPVLINCAVLTEGTDLPITDCIIMTRPTCNANLYVQMAGRGLRKHSNKEYCLIIDFIDKMRPTERSLMTFPCLLAARELKEEAKEDDGSSRVRRAYTDLDADKIGLEIVKQSPTHQIVLPRTGIAWIHIDERHFAVASRVATYVLELDPNDTGHGRILVLEQTTSAHGRRIFEVLDKGPLLPVHEALRTFKGHLRDLEVELAHCSSQAYWRRVRPISQAQSKFLFRIMTQIPGIEGAQTSQLYTWSVGRAADLITKYYLRTRYLGKPLASFADFILGVKTY